jgi:hypothetical protein
MPVTMPGSAIGRMISRESVSRPKNLKRCTAKDTIVPRIRAMAVAPSPALIDVHRASRAPELFQAADHHRVVKSCGGQANVRSPLNELTSTSSSGT